MKKTKQLHPWHKDNKEIDAEIATLKRAKGGPAYRAALAKLEGRIIACGVAAHMFLLEHGFHDDSHPELIALAVKSLTEKSDPYAEPGRPDNAKRDAWITERAGELISEGLSKTNASKQLTSEVEDRFEVLLSYRTIMNLISANKTT